MCIAELSKVTQRNWETDDLFISRFKKMRNIYKIQLLDTEYVKMAQIGLDIELRKKFQGMEFRVFMNLQPRRQNMKKCSRKKVIRGRSRWEPIVKR